MTSLREAADKVEFDPERGEWKKYIDYRNEIDQQDTRIENESRDYLTFIDNSEEIRKIKADAARAVLLHYGVKGYDPDDPSFFPEVEKHKDEIRDHFTKMLESGASGKYPQQERMQTLFDSGAAVSPEAVDFTGDQFQDRRKAMDDYTPWNFKDEEIEAKLITDQTIPLEDRNRLLVYFRKTGNSPASLIEKQDIELKPETYERIKFWKEPRWGAEPLTTRSTGFQPIRWALETGRRLSTTISTPAYRVGGDIYDLGFGGKEKLEEYMYNSIPPPEDRRQDLSEDKLYTSSDRPGATTYGYNAPVRPAVEGVIDFLNDAEQRGHTWADAKKKMSLNWKGPGTEADYAAYIGNELDRIRRIALRKAIEETGLDPDKMAKKAQNAVDFQREAVKSRSMLFDVNATGQGRESVMARIENEIAGNDYPTVDSDINLLKDRATEIAGWLIGGGFRGFTLKHPIVGQMIAETVFDPLTWVSPIIKGISMVPRAKELLKAAKANRVGDAAVHGWQMIRGAGRAAQEGVGVGYVAQASELKDAAENAVIAARRAAGSGDVAATEFGKLYNLSTPEQVLQKGSDIAAEAERTRLALRNAPRIVPRLKILEKSMLDRINAVGKFGDTDTRKLLRAYRAGDPEAVATVRALPPKEQLRFDNAVENINQWAREHKEWRELTGQTYRFGETEIFGRSDETVRLLEQGGDIPAEKYFPEVWRNENPSKPPRINMDFADGPKSSMARDATNAEGMIEDPYEALMLTHQNSVNSQAYAGAQTKRISQYARENDFMRVFAKSDEEGQNLYRETKKAITGTDFVDLEEYIGEKSKRLFGENPRGVSDFVNRVSGLVGAERGGSKIIASRAVAKSIMDSLMLGQQGGDLYRKTMKFLGPIQSLIRKGQTIASPVAFPISQLASVMPILFQAVGFKAFNPRKLAESTEVAAYISARLRGATTGEGMISKIFGKPAEAIGRRTLQFEDGPRTVEEVAKKLIDNGAFSYGVTRQGGDIAYDIAPEAVKAAGRMSKARQWVEGKTANFAEYIKDVAPVQVSAFNAAKGFGKGAIFVNDIIDTQQKVSLYLNSLKKFSDPFDHMRAAEIAQQFSFGMGSAGRGSTEKIIADWTGYYNFLRWAHTNFWKIVTSPEALGRLNMAGRVRRGMDMAATGDVPIDIGMVSDRSDGKIMAPEFFQDKNLVNISPLPKDDVSGPKRTGQHRVVTRQMEDMYQLLGAAIELVHSALNGNLISKKAAGAAVGPGISRALSAVGVDLDTDQEVTMKTFATGETQWWDTNAGQFLLETLAFPRLFREANATMKALDPKTPPERMDVGVRLAAINSSKLLTAIVNFAETGVWEEGMGAFEAAVATLDRLYPNAPITEAVKRRRRFLDRSGIRSYEAGSNQRNIPAEFTGEQQTLDTWNQGVK